MQFDLGGGRIVTAYACPGHTAGEMVFLDEYSKSLFAGDALNFNLGMGAVPVETSLRYLKRLEDMKGKYDGIYNGHHDFRALGMPLDDDCLPNVIAMCEDAMAGHIVPTEDPSFWGQSVPLTRERSDAQGSAPAMYSGAPKVQRVYLRRGRNWLGIDPNRIFEKDN